MASENAKAVARKVIEKVRKGEKVNKGAIIRSQGYSEGIATQPTKVTRTQSYQEEITPFVNKMIALRDKAINASNKKDLDSEQYHTLVGSIDTLTKNIQLLSGEDTDRQGVTIKLVSYKDDDNDSTPV